MASEGPGVVGGGDDVLAKALPYLIGKEPGTGQVSTATMLHCAGRTAAAPGSASDPMRTAGQDENRRSAAPRRACAGLWTFPPSRWFAIAGSSGALTRLEPGDPCSLPAARFKVALGGGALLSDDQLLGRSQVSGAFAATHADGGERPFQWVHDAIEAVGGSPNGRLGTAGDPDHHGSNSTTADLRPTHDWHDWHDWLDGGRNFTFLKAGQSRAGSATNGSSGALPIGPALMASAIQR